MNEKRFSIRDIAAYVICAVAGIALCYLFVRHIFGILLPFLAAWLLALATRPLAERIGRHTRIPGRVLRLAVLVVLFLAVCAGAWFGGTRLLKELEQLASRLASGDAIGSMTATLRAALARLPFPASRVEAYAESILDHGLSMLISRLPSLVGWLISSVPRAFVAGIITLVAAVYFSLDLDTIHRTCFSLIPARLRPHAARLAGGTLRVAGTYARAYLTLMALIASLLFVGFLLIGVDYALLLAVVIALVDLFPVLGVGTVLMPWAAGTYLLGDTERAIALLVLWGVTLIVRQFAEPRILAGHLGVHPLITLVLMYAGLSLFGVPGMLLAPVLSVPLISLVRGRKDLTQDALAHERAQATEDNAENCY